MNHINTTRIISVLCAAALLITAGCGDESHYDDSGHAELSQAEFAIVSIDEELAYPSVDVADLLAVDTDAEERILMLASFQNELTVPNPEAFESELAFDMSHIPDAPPVATQLNLDSQGPVCARVDTWKNFSHKSCNAIGGWLSGINTGSQCGADHYASTVFTCDFEDENGDEMATRKFESFTLGGRSTCKPYRAFADYAIELCGGAQNLREKHILGSCDRLGSEDGFSAVRFTCER